MRARKFKEAAIKILKDKQRPLSCKEITNLAIKERLIEHHGDTPIKSMYSILYKDAKKGKGSLLILKDGLFYLKKIEI